jgi:hypothetical protein
MAHFAKLNDNNIVEEVIVVHNNELLDELGNESEQKGIDFCINLFGGRWIQTSYSASLRKNYAGQGFLYDPIRDAFIEPQPYPSWILNENTCQWDAPVPYPLDSKSYLWDESMVNWAEEPIVTE